MMIQKLEREKVIWAAGVKCPILEGLNVSSYGGGNRLLVDEELRLKNHKDIYAIGDISLLISENWERGHPQVAQVAIQQAKHLAKNLIKGKNDPFVYKDLGSMATIGRNKAVVELPNFKFLDFLLG